MALQSVRFACLVLWCPSRRKEATLRRTPPTREWKRSCPLRPLLLRLLPPLSVSSTGHLKDKEAGRHPTPFPILPLPLPLPLRHHRRSVPRRRKKRRDARRGPARRVPIPPPLFFLAGRFLHRRRFVQEEAKKRRKWDTMPRIPLRTRIMMTALLSILLARLFARRVPNRKGAEPRRRRSSAPKRGVRLPAPIRVVPCGAATQRTGSVRSPFAGEITRGGR